MTAPSSEPSVVSSSRGFAVYRQPRWRGGDRALRQRWNGLVKTSEIPTTSAVKNVSRRSAIGTALSEIKAWIINTELTLMP